MNFKELTAYKRDCLFGALGALLMLVGDLCLSVVTASPGDSGLFMREAYLNGAYESWRLPLLLVTGLCGMTLGFFTVRASYRQIKPQYRKTRLALLAGGVIYIATAGTLHFFYRQSCRLDKHTFNGSRSRRNHSIDPSAIHPFDADHGNCIRGNGFDDPFKRLCGAFK